MKVFDGGERYDAKRAAGISEFRSDGSRTSRNTDVEAAEAEKFGVEFFGQSVNEEIYSRRGDGGIDCTLSGLTIDIVHLGILADGTPRMTGNLIINPHEPHRHADLYVVVRGSTSTVFEIIGWKGHDDLVALPQRDFGYGARYCCPISNLEDISLITPSLLGMPND